ncbi:MAG TPA: hypothetical protein VHA76_08915 [Solirubrobacterales bacterium]|nr:hypothetical protein [Solirubrobacterales bacterium]
MTTTDPTGFFAAYFAALDGDEPLSALEMVADDADFAILFAADEGRKAGHFRGGPDELRKFTLAGDMEGWAHYILAASRTGDVELVLGETRTDAGEFIGSFVCVVELDAEGRMKRYLTGRSPAIRFSV